MKANRVVLASLLAPMLPFGNTIAQSFPSSGDHFEECDADPEKRRRQAALSG